MKGNVIPQFSCLYDYVKYYAQVAPASEALAGSGLRYSYAELEQAVDAMAKAYLAAGVKQGDRVSMLSAPHPCFWISFLAAASIGAIWHGLNPRYQRTELSYVVGDSDPSLILAWTQIGGRDFVEDVHVLAQRNDAQDRAIVWIDGPATDPASFDAFLRAGSAISDEALLAARSGVGGRQACLLVYTSGTTGKPKGALLHHHGLIKTNSMRLTFARAYPMRVVTFLPINHVGCVGDTGCTVLMAGGCLILMDKFDPLESLETMADERATVWGSVPTTFQLCLDLPDFDRFDLSSLQLITWGGARMPVELIPRLRAICPRLATDYGMTETIGSVCYTDESDDDEVLSETVGRPAPGFEVRIVDGDRLVAPGDAGEIQVRGDFIMLGYWRRDEATAEAIDSNGWLHTGDLAVERADGRYRLIGRISEMYKSGGYNVYPKEVEGAIEELAGVSAVAVVGLPDPLYGETGHAFIVAENRHAINAAWLREACRKQLANYKIPRFFHFVNELPLLPIGKVDKQALRKIATSLETDA